MDKKEMVKMLVEHFTNGNKSQFANKLGVTAQTINSWISRNTCDIELIYAKCDGLSADWLLTGEGEMLKSEKVAISEVFSLRTDRVVERQDVPLYELDATAGLVSLFDQHTRQVPVAHLNIPNLPPCDGAIYVRGDSMYPLLKSGDLVLYKEVEGVDSILWGEMYLLSFDIDGEQFITIKYIQRADEEGYLRLVSHNPHHAPKDVRKESVRALAIVKASVRYCTMG